MTLQNQFATLKENWLIALVALILILFLSGGNSVVNKLGSNFPYESDMGHEESLAYGGRADIATSSYSPGYYGGQDFAPEVEDRKITKTTSLSSEIPRGTFRGAQAQIKTIITGSDSILLNEHANKIGEGRKSYMTANYNMKVETTKYDSVITELREVGEVTSFNENARDITASFENTQVELQAEKNRLQLYESLLDQAETTQEKIELTDRIFNQERRIGYLEESLQNLDNKVEYSTIQVSLQEKQSDYASLTLIGISDLIKSFVTSLNNVFKLIFIAIPWIIVIWILRLAYQKFFA